MSHRESAEDLRLGSVSTVEAVILLMKFLSWIQSIAHAHMRTFPGTHTRTRMQAHTLKHKHKHNRKDKHNHQHTPEYGCMCTPTRSPAGIHERSRPATNAMCSGTLFTSLGIVVLSILGNQQRVISCFRLTPGQMRKVSAWQAQAGHNDARN